MYRNFFTLLLVSEIQFVLAIKNNAAVNMGAKIPL